MKTKPYKLTEHEAWVEILYYAKANKAQVDAKGYDADTEDGLCEMLHDMWGYYHLIEGDTRKKMDLRVLAKLKDRELCGFVSDWLASRGDWKTRQEFIREFVKATKPKGAPL